MPALRIRLRTLVVGAAAIALVTIGAGGTLAASTTPTVYACYNVNGQVAMASVAQCKLAGGGQLVQINAAGVPGPQGPQGLPGATGPTGPTGSTGPNAVSSATACSTGAYSSTITFGADGDLYCGAPLSVAAGGGYVPPLDMSVAITGVVNGFGTGSVGSRGCGAGFSVDIPCSGVLAIGARAFNVDSRSAPEFRVLCPGGNTVTATIVMPPGGTPFYRAICDWTAAGPATATILAPIP